MARTRETEETAEEAVDNGVHVTQSGEEYTTRGRTRVRTPVGYEFASSDPNLPVVTPSGLFVTQEQAEFLVAESDQYDGRLFVDTDNTQEG